MKKFDEMTRRDLELEEKKLMNIEKIRLGGRIVPGLPNSYLSVGCTVEIDGNQYIIASLGFDPRHYGHWACLLGKFKGRTVMTHYGQHQIKTEIQRKEESKEPPVKEKITPDMNDAVQSMDWKPYHNREIHIVYLLVYAVQQGVISRINAVSLLAKALGRTDIEINSLFTHIVNGRTIGNKIQNQIEYSKTLYTGKINVVTQ